MNITVLMAIFQIILFIIQLFTVQCIKLSTHNPKYIH